MKAPRHEELMRGRHARCDLSRTICVIRQAMLKVKAADKWLHERK